MNKDDLYQSIIEDLPIKVLHPLHKAILQECCENALASNTTNVDKTSLVNIVQIAFLTSNSTLKSTLNSALIATGTNQITLQYRNQSFIIDEFSNVLKDEL